MEVDQGDVEEAIDGEPMPKRPRHFASSSLSLKQQLSPLARELAQAVRALVEADKKADDEGEEQQEEEEERGDAIDASEKTSTTSTPLAAAPEVSAAASALEKLLRALSQARKAGEKAVTEGIERALDEWREGVEVRKMFFSSALFFFFSLSQTLSYRFPFLLRASLSLRLNRPPAPASRTSSTLPRPLRRGTRA